MNTTQRLQMTILISVISLVILILTFIVLRIISRKNWQKMEAQIPVEYQRFTNLLKHILANQNYPPLLLFKISLQTAKELLDNSDKELLVLEEQKKKGIYKYHIVQSPCVFQFKTSQKLDYPSTIAVESRRSLVFTYRSLNWRDQNYSK